MTDAMYITDVIYIIKFACFLVGLSWMCVQLGKAIAFLDGLEKNKKTNTITKTAADIAADKTAAEAITIIKNKPNNRRNTNQRQQSQQQQQSQQRNQQLVESQPVVSAADIDIVEACNNAIYEAMAEVDNEDFFDYHNGSH